MRGKLRRDSAFRLVVLLVRILTSHGCQKYTKEDRPKHWHSSIMGESRRARHSICAFRDRRQSHCQPPLILLSLLMVARRPKPNFTSSIKRISILTSWASSSSTHAVPSTL